MGIKVPGSVSGTHKRSCDKVARGPRERDLEEQRSEGGRWDEGERRGNNRQASGQSLETHTYWLSKRDLR